LGLPDREQAVFSLGEALMCYLGRATSVHEVRCMLSGIDPALIVYRVVNGPNS
jgi:hypothetical protein